MRAWVGQVEKFGLRSEIDPLDDFNHMHTAAQLSENGSKIKN